MNKSKILKFYRVCFNKEHTLYSETYSVIDSIYYDEFSSDTSSRYYTNSNYTSLAYQDNSLKVTFGGSARYLRLRTNENNILSDLQGKTITFKSNIKTSGNTTCSIIYSTPSQSNVTISGNTINHNGVLIVTGSIPVDATQVIFNINVGTTGMSITVTDWLIYED